MSNKKNQQIRKELEKIYGEGCFFQKAKIEQRIEQIGGIKTYKQFKEQHRYKLKKIKVFENMMALHHLKHLSEGGQTTLENGAVVGSLPHMYLHSLPREQEEIINDMLREYKKCKVVIDDIDIDCELHCGLMENGEIIEAKRLTKNEIKERERRKEKKEFERERKNWEDR